MINRETDLEKFEAFIESFSADPDFSDPSVLAKKEKGKGPEDFLEKKSNRCFSVTDAGEIRGLFIFLILSDEKYMEMLVGLSRNPDAVEEMLVYLEEKYPGYEIDFVFNPRNRLLRQSLKKRGAKFDTEQQKMVYTHTAPACKTDGIEYLTPGYEKQYLEMHSKDRYWTGEKVIEAKDRFRVLIAVEGGKVVGYLDVTHCYEENEPYDIVVKPEYRRKGFGRKLLYKALLDNEPKGMMLFADVDNVPAISLYESMGFVRKENGNTLTAFWYML